MPKYIQISELLIRDIQAGRLLDGERLPPDTGGSAACPANRQQSRKYGSMGPAPTSCAPIWVGMEYPDMPPVAQLIISPRDPKGPVALDIPVDPTLLAAGDHNGSTFYQTQRFLNVVRGKGTPEVTLGDGAWAVAIGLVAQQSAATGQAVTISDPLWRRCEKKQIPPRNCVIFQQAFAKLV